MLTVFFYNVGLIVVCLQIALSQHAVAKQHLRNFEQNVKKWGFREPHFLRDMTAYMKALDEIAKANGIEGDGSVQRKRLRVSSARRARVPEKNPEPPRSVSVLGTYRPIERWSDVVADRHTGSVGGWAKMERYRSVLAPAQQDGMLRKTGSIALKVQGVEYGAVFGAPGEEAARQAAKLQETALRRKSLRRSLTEERLHASHNKKMARTNTILESCFRTKSRWGGVAFQWD